MLITRLMEKGYRQPNYTSLFTVFVSVGCKGGENRATIIVNPI